MFYLLVKNLLDTFTHGGYSMIGTVKGDAVAEDQADVGYKFFRIVVTWVLRIGIGLRRIRRIEFSFDRRKIHRILNNTGVVRNVQSDRVDRIKERCGIF